MNPMRVQPRWRPVADVSSLRLQAVKTIAESAQRAIRERGSFHLVLAGGETPRTIYGMLRDVPTDWSAWHIYFGDERCAPPTDPARNSHMAFTAWLSYVPISSPHIHSISGELGPELAAKDYADRLKSVGEFDLVLLGLGEDGHTASLFPGNDWGVSSTAPDAIAVLNAPKPPPERVSLSAFRLSRSREVLFLVSGTSKRDAVSAWRRGENIPARVISPAAGVDVLIEAALLELPSV